MGLFSLFRKKEKSSCCDIKIDSVAPQQKEILKASTPGSPSLIVLGTGCAKCKTTVEVIKRAIEAKGIEANLEKEEDIEKIMEYGVMQTPAIVLNGKVVLKGKVPTESEIVELLEKSQGNTEGNCCCGK